MILIQAVQRSNSMSARVYLIKTNKNISIKKKEAQDNEPLLTLILTAQVYHLVLFYIIYYEKKPISIHICTLPF